MLMAEQSLWMRIQVVVHYIVAKNNSQCNIQRFCFHRWHCIERNNSKISILGADLMTDEPFTALTQVRNPIHTFEHGFEQPR